MPITKEVVVQFVTKLIAEKLLLDVREIRPKQSLFSLGVTSLVSEEIMMSLRQNYDSLSSTFLFEYPSVNKIADFLSQKTPIENAPIIDFLSVVESEIVEPKMSSDDYPKIKSSHESNKLDQSLLTEKYKFKDIAVIGINGQFPKAANYTELWSNLVNQVDCIETVPESRWDVNRLYSTDRTARNALFGKWGGFLKDIEFFDPSFFKISHREAELLDPQQKLFLQSGWQVMEDAGYGNSDTRGTDNIGVYVGVTWNEFSIITHDQSVEEKTYKGAGSLYWGIPNRLSYTLDLKGPSLAIDSACSSSLVAIQEACAALQTGICDMAIAGGVNLNLHPDKYLFLSQNHFLSSEGKCRSFGEGGDGYVPSEGVATVLLKPLIEAKKDGDFIYGVVKSSMNNHGGKVTGYTVPNPVAHTEVISKAFEMSGVDPDDISYIECHGTGTELGDPIEITGLTHTFRKYSKKRRFCGIGSVKSNIGHLEAAAGVAGVIKVLLSMQNNLLPGSLHSKIENSKLDLKNSPFYLVSENKKWVEKDKPLIAGISSFGAGGSNAHVVLESYSYKHYKPVKETSKSLTPIVISSESEEQLNQQVKNLLQFVKSFHKSPMKKAYHLGDVAYSLLMGRSEFNCRALFLVGSFDALEKSLTLYLKSKGKHHKNIFNSILRSDERRISVDIKELSLNKWCAHWVQGDCEASTYYQLKNVRPMSDRKKIPLPAYPFAKERSWIREGYPLINIEVNHAATQTQNNNSAIHPLVDRNASTLYEQVFEKEFNINEFVLEDHLVNEVHVIPGVCHLEIMRECASKATQNSIPIVKDVWFYNVISVEDSRAIEIKLTVDDENLSCHVVDKDSETVFSRGRISWQSKNDKEIEIEAIHLAEIQTRLNDYWDIPNVYQKFIETGIIQKDSFQVLNRIGFNQDECLSRLILPQKLKENFSQYVFHPALMDGLVQTAMMHVQYLSKSDVKILPFHFSEVSYIAPLEEEVFVHCRVVEFVNKRFDLVIVNKEGKPLVNVKGFILKQMKPDSDTASLEKEVQATNQQSQDQNDHKSPYYTTEFVAQPLNDLVTKPIRTLNVIEQEFENNALSNAHVDINPQNLIVTYGSEFRESDNGFVIRADNENDYVKMVNRLAERNQLPDLVSFYSAKVSKANSQTNEHKLDLDIDSKLSSYSAQVGLPLFLLSKAFIPKLKKLKLNVVVASQSNVESCLYKAALGFFKTLKVEKPSFIGSIIELDKRDQSLEELYSFSAKEALSLSSVSHVRYKNGTRYLSNFKNIAKTESEQVVFRENGTYLITGGMGGIGLVFAEYIANKHGSTVYLTGRSKIDERKKRTLNLLNKDKELVHYIACDVNSEDDLKSVVERIETERNTLNGVIHSAGSIEDNFILRKDKESFLRVLEPKVDGVINLDNATKSNELDFFVLFSSVTAILGNLGQCDYGFANAFQDDFASYREKLKHQGLRQGRTLSINWPYWKNGGMQLTEKEEEQLKHSFGITPLSNEDGIEALIFGLVSEVNQLAVLKGDSNKIESLLSPSEKQKQDLQSAKIAQDSSIKVNARKYLIDIFASELKIPREKIDTKSSFERYGFDSIVMIDLINIMDKKFDDLPKTLFFEFQTIDDLAEYFANNHAPHFQQQELASHSVSTPFTAANNSEIELTTPDITENKAVRFSQLSQSDSQPIRSRSINQDIAVIGVAGRYPQAPDLNAFWKNLCEGTDCVTEIPSSLWDLEAFYNKAKQQKGKSYGKWGGFISDVDQFDAAYFNITPKEAEVTDPQERLFLQCATHAIQDAGYTSDTLATINNKREGTKVNPVGVFVGVMWGDYQLHGVSSSNASEWTTPRSFYWGIANRVSFFHNFTGPSMAIDTACSSSISAIHLACESIKQEQVEVAIAGGVNLSLHPNKYNLLSQMQFLSTDGRCRSFGEGGDGYVPGDGVGAVILKPLTQAELDGDSIYAVIKGTSLNHGGKASGFTVPNPILQAELIKDAMQAARISPRHISYVEAHGTGTSLGDPVEMIGLNKAYQQSDKQYCSIGSVKSNIGHLEAAAGIAALTKVILQLKYKKLVPSLHSEQLNQHIDFSNTPFKVQHTLEEWKRLTVVDENDNSSRIEVPRTAGISSFGAGGSNAHLIVEEYRAKNHTKTPSDQASEAPLQSIIFSAHNERSLLNMIRNFSIYLDDKISSNDSISLEKICYTLQVGREHLNQRCGFLVRNVKELSQLLITFLENKSARENKVDKIYYNNLTSKNLLATVFLEEDNLHGLVKKYIQENAQKNILIAWMSGVDIRWSEVYKIHSESQPIGRVNLPGYVFDTKRYWTDVPTQSTSIQGFHPLLDRNISHFEQQLFIKQFTNNDSVIAEHLINGKSTLPASAMLEMALQATMSSLELKDEYSKRKNELIITISNVVWARPIALINDAINVQVELLMKDGSCLFEVSKEVFANSDLSNNAFQPCSQGKILIQPRTSIGDGNESVAGTDSWNGAKNINENNVENEDVYHEFENRQNQTKRLDLDKFNARLQNIGFKFGSSFNVFSRLSTSNHNAISELQLNSNVSTESYVLFPQLLDAAFRTCLAIDAENIVDLKLQVPVSMGSFEIHHQINTNCIVVAEREESSNENTQGLNQFDLTIYAKSGLLIGKIKNFKTRKITQTISKVSEKVASVHSEKKELTSERGLLFNTVKTYLVSMLAKVSKLQENDIDSEVALEKYGIDSVMIMSLNDELEIIFGELSKTLFFEHQDIQSLAGYLVENYATEIKVKLGEYSNIGAHLETNKVSELAVHPESSFVEEVKPNIHSENVSSMPFDQSLVHQLIDFKQLKQNTPKINSQPNNVIEQDIAVIGISGRFPGAANTDELWNVLAGSQDCIKEIPLERWDYNEFFEEKTLEQGKMSSKWGGFIDGHDLFDAHLFNILPNQAQTMDPQERLFLQCVWSTLEDAGYTPSTLIDNELNKNIGVFAGSMWNHYDLVGLEESLKGNPTVNFSWDASIANRVSYYFNFKGPSIMLDTACSTSLLAIHQACESIRKGECSSAIAGGVNLSVHPYKYEVLTQMQMLSAAGRCHSFGADADGYVPGEGVASVLLKPLAKAIEDNDNIYGVIKGGAVNHNGKTNGFTVPNPNAQEECFLTALNNAKLTAKDISYFEAHGTGTSLGDPIEFSALDKVFKMAQGSVNQCALGSLKSNIGHLEGAAGVASLIKVLLQLKYKKIAPSLHSKNLNPNIRFGGSSLFIPQELDEWTTQNNKRAAAIASLGAGGANTYLIVEEYETPLAKSASKNTLGPSKHSTTRPYLFMFSGKTLKSLIGNMYNIASFIEERSPQLSINSVAFTLREGRVALEHRVAIIATSLDELLSLIFTTLSELETNKSLVSSDNRCYGYFEKAMEKGWANTHVSSRHFPVTNSFDLYLDLQNLKETAKNWVEGHQIDWKNVSLADSVKAGSHRISLPTYRFDESQYWAKKMSSNRLRTHAYGKISNVESLKQTHSLISTNTSDFNWISFQTTFSASQYFIRDHKVNERMIVPGVVLLEMALQAFGFANKSSVDLLNGSMTFKNVQWCSPCIVLDSTLTEIRLERSNGHFEIAERPTEETDYSKNYKTLLTGQYTEKEEHRWDAPSFSDLLKIHSLVDVDIDETYSYYRRLGLEYGNYFNVTNAVSVLDSSALIKLNSRSVDSLNCHYIEPSLLDGALRSTLMILNKHSWKQLLIPHSIDSIKFVSPTSNEVYVFIELDEIDVEFKTYSKSNIFIYDLNGNLCCIIKGFKAVSAIARPTKEGQEKSIELVESTRLVANDEPIKLPVANSEELNREALAYVKRTISKATGMSNESFNVNQSFDSLGIDSITIVKLNKLFERDFQSLSKTLFFECNTSSKIVDYLIEHHYDELCIVCGVKRAGHSVSALSASQSKSELTKNLRATQKENLIQSENVFLCEVRRKMGSLELEDGEFDLSMPIIVIGRALDQSASLLPFINIQFGNSFESNVDGNNFVIRKEVEQDLIKALSIISENGNTPKSIVYYEPEVIDWLNLTKEMCLSDNVIDQLKRTMTTSMCFLQSLVKILTNDYSDVITQLLHVNPGVLSSAQPQWEAYMGFANTLKDINNHLTFTKIAFHPCHINNDVFFEKMLFNELYNAQKACNNIEYNVFGDRSAHVTIEKAIKNDSQAQLPLYEEGVYIISGGLGSLGKVTCEYLAERSLVSKTEISICLIGRSEVNEAINQYISEKTNEYASVFYHKADITEFNVTEQTINNIRQSLGVIKGVFHCAGLSADIGLLNATAQEFMLPVQSKCFGTINLDLTTREDQLDFFILYSSVTSQIGDFGAASYAMGNSFQNSYAIHREYLKTLGRCSGRTLSIAWPMWETKGLNHNSDIVQLYLDDYGMEMITPEQGIEILRQSWNAGQPFIAAYFGNKSLILDKVIHSGIFTSKASAKLSFNDTLSGEINEELNEKLNDSSLKGHDTHESVNHFNNEPKSLFDFHSNNRYESVHASDVAVIGLNGVYPGANDLDDFWNNLVNATDSISEIPKERWDHNEFYSSNRHQKGKAYSKWGGFIEGVDRFDAFQFSIAPREAQLMDPQERLFLQTAFHCIEDAGYSKSSLSESKVGVFVGTMWGQYQLFDIQEEQVKYGLPGSSFSAIANHVSYYFNFNGPCFALDTMCSSSLTAIHLARKSLLAGDCQYALAGGINLTIHPDKYHLLSQGQFLADDGRCRSFGEGGSGYVPGEGVGAVFLKRMTEALNDNDHIYGVIKSTSINHGGRTNAFTVPNPLALSEVIGQSIKDADWNPRTISYIEAHGTGTPLGDPIEINGLNRAYRQYTQDNQYCAIGSVKSNIGHLESASGVAGLTKILLQLKHKKIVPSLHSEILNKNIDFLSSPFVVSRSTEEWKEPVIIENDRSITYPRRAGLSSFGAGGSNAHLLIEEYSAPAQSISERNSQTQNIFIFSAKNNERLTIYLKSFVGYLEGLTFSNESEEALFLSNLAFTLQVGREPEAERFAVVTHSILELKTALRTELEGGDSIGNRASINLQHANLENLLNDDQKSNLVNSFITDNNLTGLASLWVNALSVNWSTLTSLIFGSFIPRRINAPYTPLIGSHCWIKAKSVNTFNENTNRFNKELHPLIDENMSTLHEQMYKKVFTGNEFYLNDHVIDQSEPLKVLPGVAYIEMARAAAEHAIGHKIKGLGNLIWGSLLTVNSDKREVVTEIKAENERLEFAVKSRLNDDMIEHSRGDILLLDKLSETPKPIDVESMIQSMSQHYDKETLYRYYDSIGFKYGPTFQVSEAAYASESKAISLLKRNKAYDSATGFYLHPSLMDAALRTCLIVVNMSPDDESMVPFAVDHVEFYGEVTSDCYAIAELVGEEVIDENTTTKFNVLITDLRGEVLVAVKGLTARKLTPLNNTINYYQKELQSSRLTSESSLSGEVILLLINDKAMSKEISGYFSKNNTIISVANGDAYNVIESNQYEISRNNKEDYVQLLKDVQKGGLIPTKIISALTLGVEQDNNTHDASGRLEISLDETIYCVVNMFQALMETGLNDAIHALYLYERDVNERHISHAGLSGLAKSLLGINHRFVLSTAGFDRTSLKTISTLVENELTNTQRYSGQESFYIDNQRNVTGYRVIDSQFQSENIQPIRLVKGGCYIITGGLGKLGQFFTTYLLNKWDASVILTGRSPSSDFIEEQLNTLLNEKSYDNERLSYFSCDLSSKDSVKSLFKHAKEVSRTINRSTRCLINGVIHSAGVVDEKTILEVEKTDIERVLKPKVQCTRILMDVMSEEKVEHLILFSSVSSYLGDLGGGSYAYANRYLDQIALNNTADTTKIVSINWPLWESGGMDIPPEEIAFYKFSGISPISSEQAIEAFERVLELGLSNVFIAPGNSSKISSLLRVIKNKESLLMPSENHQRKRIEAKNIRVDSNTLVSKKAASGISTKSNSLVCFLKETLSEIIDLPTEQVETTIQFQNYGLNSVLLMEFNKQLEKVFKGLVKTVLFEYDSIKALADYLEAHHKKEIEVQFAEDEALVAAEHFSNTDKNVPESDKPKDLSSPLIPQSNRYEDETKNSMASFKKSYISRSLRLEKESIIASSNNLNKVAVIGLSGEFPNSSTLNEFWKSVVDGTNCLKEIPSDRWEANRFYNPTQEVDPKKSSSKWGGFLDQVYGFDYEFFNMSHEEAMRYDPQMLKMMSIAWQAVEDAGYNPATLTQSKFGVYVGVMNDDFTWMVSDAYTKTGQYYGSGSFASDIANKISTLLNVNGPSLTVETACASSSTAIHLARNAIMSGECTMALAGGVNLTLHHGKYLMLDSLKLLAPDGIEKTFDNKADGMVPSEGAGLVLLKHFEQAKQDGDHIYGVISGSAIGHSGVGPATNVPSVRSLETNIVSAIQQSGLKSDELDYIECHGTGTSLGDPIELKALNNALKKLTDKTEFCAIGSKANFGHMESASGVCSLIKVLLSMKNKTIGPCASLNDVNQAFDVKTSPFYFPKTAISWKSTRANRIAGINSFGLGGSNAFLVVESYEDEEIKNVPGQQIIVLSARTQNELEQQVKNLKNRLMEEQDASLSSIAYTLQLGRKAFTFKVAFISREIEELTPLIDAFLSKNIMNNKNIVSNAYSQKNETVANDDITTLIKEKRVFELACHWVNGRTVEWSKLHQTNTRKCSLPTYPFNLKDVRLNVPDDLFIREQVKPNTQLDIKPVMKDGLLVSESNLELSKTAVSHAMNSVNMASSTDKLNIYTIPSEWYKSTLNKVDRLSKQALKKIGETSAAFEMTPLQIQQYELSRSNDRNIGSSITIELSEKFDASLVMDTWRVLIADFDCLRTVFLKVRKQYYQAILASNNKMLSESIVFKEVDNYSLDDVSLDELQSSLRDYSPSLNYKASVVTQSNSQDGKFYLAFMFAQSLLSKTSATIITNCFSHVYASLANGEKFTLKTNAFNKSDYQSLLNQEHKQSSFEFWNAYLSQLNQTKRLLKEIKASGERLTIVRELPNDLFTKIQLFKKDVDSNSNILFTLSWAKILSRLTKAKYASFSIRNHEQLKNCFMITHQKLPILVTTSVRKSVVEWIKDTQHELNQMESFLGEPIPTLVNGQQLSAFNESEIIFEQEDTSKLNKETLESTNKTKRLDEQLADLVIKVTESDSSYSMSIGYHSNQIELDVVCHILDLFEVVIPALIDSPSINPAAISMSTAEEKRNKFWQTLEKNEGEL